MGIGFWLPPAVGSQTNNARRFGRVRVHAIGCSIGELLDLSAIGARLRCKGRRGPGVGQDIILKIEGLDGEISVAARVVWTNRLGWFRHEIGVEFAPMSGQVRAALTALARTAPANQTMGLNDPIRKSA